MNTRISSEVIRMEFGISKCGILVVEKGKHTHIEGLERNREKLQGNDVKDGYKSSLHNWVQHGTSIKKYKLTPGAGQENPRAVE